jgi:arylformamidase
MTVHAELIELSHPIRDGEAGYPDLPAPRVRPHVSHATSRGAYEDGATFEITHLSLVGNTGTYLDSPAHRFLGRPDVAALPLERLVDLPAVLVDAPHEGREVSFPVTDDMCGAAVLVRTGWDARRGTSRYFDPAPFLSTRTAVRLAEAGAALVGVDTWNVDDTALRSRPVHTALLDAGVVVVEHLRNLDLLPTRGAQVSVVPLQIEGAVSAPVRAWARLPAG